MAPKKKTPEEKNPLSFAYFNRFVSQLRRQTEINIELHAILNKKCMHVSVHIHITYTNPER